MRKLKKDSIAWHKNRAWKAFSKYIRLRDCLVTMGSKEYGKCITCEREYPLTKLQAGHFIDGRSASILFDEEIVNAQCYGCNVMKAGNKDSYTPIMIEKYGLKKVEEFWRKKHIVHQWQRDELIEIKKKYEDEYKFIYDNN